MSESAAIVAIEALRLCRLLCGVRHDLRSAFEEVTRLKRLSPEQITGIEADFYRLSKKLSQAGQRIRVLKRELQRTEEKKTPEQIIKELKAEIGVLSKQLAEALAKVAEMNE